MIPPPILFEDDDLLIVDKPAGIVVHPTYKNPGGTLLDAIATRGGRPSVVGRLDKFTSGIVLIAKRPAVHAALQRVLADSSSEKIYVAVVGGTSDAGGTIDLPLATDPADRRRRVVSSSGAASVTMFERLDTGTLDGSAVSLLQCRLVTGRRHQIRVHLAARGWPVLGDTVYGEPLEDFPRLALHARRLAFAHPLTSHPIVVNCRLPVELDALLERCALSMRQNYTTAPPEQTARR
jgi:23S rRNA pseudouridine1911/1915/1917 synthase